MTRLSRSLRLALRASLTALALLLPLAAQATSPVRISVKFILDQNGVFPMTAPISSAADVQDQVDRANEIYAALGSELHVELVEVLNVAGASKHHDAEISSANLKALRADAQSDPQTYLWRTNAVNVYITNGGGEYGGYAGFPSDNNIVVLGAGASFTPLLAHELGHILHDFHTHETNGGGDGDACNDTIKDMASWTRSDISQNAFGVPDTDPSLTAAQLAQIDAVWKNLMSYHDFENVDHLTPCQMDRQSKTAWDDRGWMLGKGPIYVDPYRTSSDVNGSWSKPYRTIDEAIAGQSLVGQVMVLMRGPHVMTQPIDRPGVDVELVSRAGPATVSHPGPRFWRDLPHPDRSASPAVRAELQRARDARVAGDHGRAIEALERAAGHARGNERLAILWKLAQRERQSGDYAAARDHYREIYAAAGEELELQRYAEIWIGRCEEALRARP